MRKISYVYLIILILSLFSIAYFVNLIIKEGYDRGLLIFTIMTIFIFTIFLSITMSDLKEYRKEDISKSVFNIKKWPNVDEIDWEYVWDNRKELSEKYGTPGYWSNR